MSNILPFMYGSQEIRTITIDDEPWFVAKDVCAVLELTNPTMAIQTLENDERAKFNLGRQGETNIVNESGLYSLIFGSRKPEAKKFKRWITQDVIPSIRKHGGYLTPTKLEEVLLNPDTLIQLATNLKDERAKREQLQLQVEKDKPKVIFAEALETSSNTILIGELAKLLKQNGIDVGQNRLFHLLREQGYLGSKGEYRNIPTQRSMDLKLFEIKTRTINNADGSIRVTKTTKVTGKGQSYFINKFKRDQAV
ncbi:MULTISPECIES: phage antirepressor KilAC domain-containing protein [Paenibacillus]|uniref:Anti-repressor protein n=1 Tax=Paenibacillus pabuli TaxID=1472 RepID=A0A855Y4V7_9BACL|nr:MULTISPECIES: phage antirepressor [Paenibacillus]PWW37338.1 anti-repressor protein [Paenibacillus pabuli]PXW05480.1 anti-repressor protein [Paenibacillus taichungensis]